METTKTKFFTCKNDVAFKLIICNNDNKKYLLAILSTIFKRQFTDVTILNTELITKNLHVRRKMVDLLLKDGDSTIIVELNAYKRNNFRNYAYLCSEIASKTKVNEVYDTNYKFYQINLTYNMASDEDFTEYYMQSKYQKKYVENVCIIEYDMDRLRDYYENNNKEKIAEYKYLMMLDMQLDELANLEKESELIMDYKKDLEAINQNAEYIPYMTALEDDEKMRNTELNLAKKEGIQEGIQEGKKIRDKELIKKLIKSGKKIKEISELLDLDEKDIKDLLESIEL